MLHSEYFRWTIFERNWTVNFKILTLLLGLTVISCQQTTHNEREISDLKNQADSIATVSQMILLQNVAGAIQKEE